MRQTLTPQFIFGPCSLESYEQLESVLKFAKDSLSTPLFIRAGLYKMRTSPQSFQGLRSEGVKIIKELKKVYQFTFVTEVSSEAQIEECAEITDIFQVGTRSMYNYELLKTLSTLDRPVLLKRGLSATVKEWLESLNYLISSQLNEEDIILCERGIRTFSQETRNTLDLASVILLKHQGLKSPIFVDPSHAMGKRELVYRAALSAIAAGADGLLIESHPHPQMSLSDADQAIDFETLKRIIDQSLRLSQLLNTSIFENNPLDSSQQSSADHQQLFTY